MSETYNGGRSADSNENRLSARRTVSNQPKGAGTVRSSTPRTSGNVRGAGSSYGADARNTVRHTSNGGMYVNTNSNGSRASRPTNQNSRPYPQNSGRNTSYGNNNPGGSAGHIQNNRDVRPTPDKRQVQQTYQNNAYRSGDGGHYPSSRSNRGQYPPQNRRGNGGKSPNNPVENFFKWLMLILLFVALALIIITVAVILGGNRKGGEGSESSADISTVGDADPTQNTDECTEPSTDTTTEPVTDAETEPEYQPPAPEFTSDLTEYEEYMNPTGDQRDAYTLLINIAHPLDASYKPSDLTAVADTRKDGRATQYMCYYAEKALEAMLIEARACGCKDLSVTSAYRSYEYQTTLFNNRIAMYPSLSYEEAYKKAAAVVAIPGTSEHQSGLCCDLHNLATGASITFGDTPEGKWLAENCWKFGFIIRFPEDKTDITMISYEPWHFRYVGRYHAYRIYSEGLCFEEYAEKYLG